MIEHKIVAVSGGFDPVHIGHIQLFKEAKKLGNYLVVILNDDEWLKRKKGKPFMNEKERAAIIMSIKYVDHVIIYHSKNRDVSGALRKFHVDIFANGGDRRNEEDIPEAAVCKELGIEMIFNVGGDKIQSSSWLTKKTQE